MFPPLSALNEAPADDPELEAAGIAKVTGDGTRPVEIIGHMVTWNETFGPVFRVDYGDPRFPLRAVVWRKPDGECVAMVAALDDLIYSDG